MDKRARLETRACHMCGEAVVRRPSEFKAEKTFCGYKCSNLHHNRKMAEGSKVDKVCAQCAARFQVLTCYGFRKFCSQKCMGMSKRKVEIRKCAHDRCGKDYVVKRDNPGSTFCSDACYNSFRARGSGKCIVCSSDYPLNRDRSVTCSALCAARLRNMNMSPEAMAEKIIKLRAAGVRGILRLKDKYGKVLTKGTYIEVALGDAMAAAGIKFRTQVPLLGITRADFFIEPDIVVYADGMAWHSSLKAIARDTRQNAALAAAGYRVLRFTGKRIRAEPSACVDEISALLPVPTDK